MVVVTIIVAGGWFIRPWPFPTSGLRPSVAAVVGVVLWGSLAGSMLPLLLRRIGLDPATSSAPFVATLVDVTGLIIYFTAAVALLRGTVL